MLGKYFFNILIALDQLINTLCGGDPDETISSRVGKWVESNDHKTGIRKIVYKVVHFIVELFEKDHLKKHIERDEGKNAIKK